MNNFSNAIGSLIFGLLCFSQQINAQIDQQSITTDYFGVSVTDPYRALENLEDPQVIEWFKSQEAWAEKQLNRIPGKALLIAKMKEFDAQKTASIRRVKILENGIYFYLKTLPEENRAKLYRRQGYNGTEEMIYDPAQLGTDKEYVIGDYSPSPLGNFVTLKITADGAEKGVLKILDVVQKSFLEEIISPVWFSNISWLKDESGFFYNKLNEGSQNQSSAYFHELHQDPIEDTVVFSHTEYPEFNISPTDFPVVRYNKDSNYLFLNIYNVDPRLQVFFIPFEKKLLQNKRIQWKRLFQREDNIHQFITRGCDLYAKSADKSPNFKIIKLSLCEFNLKDAKTLIHENKEHPIESLVITKEGLVFSRSFNGIQKKLFFFDEETHTPKEIPLPKTAGNLFLSSRGSKFNDIWITLVGWASDYSRYRYTDNEFLFEPIEEPINYPEFEDIIVQEITVPSHDGVRVPLSIIHKKGLQKDGNNPVLFRGYGAYGMSMSPYFSPNYLLWVHFGGILAIPHVRGGGELGINWHMAGHKETKPNTWKDLIAYTEYMIQENFTQPSKVAILGGSAGGILVGRAMTERPDLFGAVIAKVGVMNPLRMEASPNGPANTPEFGTIEDPEEWMALIKSDSYLALKKNTSYPATLLTAGMNDPRVVAWQPGKFAARLQEVNTSEKPILFKVDFDGGHGIGNTKDKRFEELANVLGFAFWQTSHPLIQKK